MNKEELIGRFKEWRDNDENEKIIAAFLVLPRNNVDSELLMWLAQAYIDVEEYKRAVSVLEGLHEGMENDYKWHFMMGVALLRATDDEECYDRDDLKISILERAKVCFARGMNMNPPDNVLDAADKFMEEIEMLLEEINGPPDEDYNEDVECYDDEELDVIEEHIKEYFGDFPTVFHEITSRDFICDIACIPPTEEKNYYTLVTMGMGAHIMTIPDALSPEESGRAELLICLPPDWKLGENDVEWFWPISLLKDLARLPANLDSWLGWGHSVDHRGNLAPNTKFCASLLLLPDAPDGAEYCVLPNGDKVNFFEVVPMYREEMDFKVSHDTKALLERLKNVGHVVDINRENVCEGLESENKSPKIIDSAESHSGKIVRKKLPLDEINGCNHLAIFLRWSIEHDLVAPEFYENCPNAVKGVKDGSQTDLRRFLLDYFDGYLEPFQFCYIGACFADYYYNWDRPNRPHFYPADVDNYAEQYFGTEKYNSAEFQDEAYLFVPFNEEYYKGMSKHIDLAFKDFFTDFVEWQYKSDTTLCKEAEKKLGAKLVLPKYNEFAKAFRDTAYTAKTSGTSALPMIVDKCGATDTEEAVSDILHAATDAFLTTSVIAQFPSADPTAWAEKNFPNAKPKVISPNENMSSLRNILKGMFGEIPAIFTFDDDSTSLLLPLDNGKNYIMYNI